MFCLNHDLKKTPLAMPEEPAFLICVKEMVLGASVKIPMQGAQLIRQMGGNYCVCGFQELQFLDYIQLLD